MDAALIALGALFAAASLIPLSRREVWWVRMFDFPRAQLLVLSLLTLGGLSIGRAPLGVAGWVVVLALAAGIAYQIYMIYPYTRLAPKQVPASAGASREAVLRLVFANVLMTNRNAARLREILREADPDIVLALETDRWWRNELRALERTHPHTVQQPQDNTYGMLLYSRLPLERPEIRFLVDPEVPSIRAATHLPCGRTVQLYCVHPRPPFLTTSQTSLPRDAELLIVGKEVAERTLPTVVFGDLNDVAWSRSTNLFQRVSRLLDPRIGRGFYNTFHARYPLLRFPLDHFFHSEEFRLVRFRRLADFGSDHFPVLIELSCEPESAPPPPRPDADDRRRARRKIERAT